MSNGMILLAQGIEGAGSLNEKLQFTTCDQAINDTSAYCQLSNGWSTKLNTDESQCFEATMAVSPSNPGEAATAAAAHAQYNEDSSTMNQETSSLETQIQNLEAQLQREGKSMQTVYNLESPVNSLESNITQLLKQKF